MAWIAEANDPEVWDNHSFSSIVWNYSEEYYYTYVGGITAVEFYHYNITDNIWTKKATPPAYLYQGLALNPSKTKVCGRTTNSQYLYIYDIDGNSWTTSAVVPDAYTMNSHVWATADAIWCNVRKYVSSKWRVRFMKYTPSTDSWTSYSNYMLPVTNTFPSSCVSISGDILYSGSSGVASIKYTISTDTYSAGTSLASAYYFAWTCDRNRLWFGPRRTTPAQHATLTRWLNPDNGVLEAIVFTEKDDANRPSNMSAGISETHDMAITNHDMSTQPNCWSENVGGPPPVQSILTVKIGEVDLSDYILGIHIERGEDSELAEATTGSCQLICDNHEGDFSPENVDGEFYPDLQLGSVVKVYETFEGTARYLFTGRIDAIDPRAEPTSPYAYISVLDGMDDMAGTEISTVLRTDTDSGTLVDDILDAVGWDEDARDIDTGSDVLQLAWFHKIDALEAIHILERVEHGRFFISPTGVATWHNRHHRITGAGLVSQFDVAETSVELDYEYNKRDIRNEINLRGRRYYSGGGATLFSGYDLATIDSDLIWSAHAGDAGAPYIPQQTSLTLWADMNAPMASYDELETDIHWNANTAADKTGVDITADIDLVQTQYGQSVKLVFTNNGTVGAYLVEPDSAPLGAPEDRTVLVYGTLYGEDVMGITEADATSQTAYGKRSLNMDLPFKSNPNDILSMAQYLKAKYKDPVPRAVSVTMAQRTGWPNTTIKVQCLTREISDRITVASSRLGFDQDFYINKIVQDFAFNEGRFMANTTWYIERAIGNIDELFWILGEAGFSEVGETTYIGF